MAQAGRASLSHRRMSHGGRRTCVMAFTDARPTPRMGGTCSVHLVELEGVAQREERRRPMPDEDATAVGLRLGVAGLIAAGEVRAVAQRDRGQASGVAVLRADTGVTDGGQHGSTPSSPHHCGVHGDEVRLGNLPSKGVAGCDDKTRERSGAERFSYSPRMSSRASRTA